MFSLPGIEQYTESHREKHHTSYNYINVLTVAEAVQLWCLLMCVRSFLWIQNEAGSLMTQ